MAMVDRFDSGGQLATGHLVRYEDYQALESKLDQYDQIIYGLKEALKASQAHTNEVQLRLDQIARRVDTANPHDLAGELYEIGQLARAAENRCDDCGQPIIDRQHCGCADIDSAVETQGDILTAPERERVDALLRQAIPEAQELRRAREADVERHAYKPTRHEGIEWCVVCGQSASNERHVEKQNPSDEEIRRRLKYPYPFE